MSSLLLTFRRFAGKICIFHSFLFVKYDYCFGCGWKDGFAAFIRLMEQKMRAGNF